MAAAQPRDGRNGRPTARADAVTRVSSGQAPARAVHDGEKRQRKLDIATQLPTTGLPRLAAFDKRNEAHIFSTRRDVHRNVKEHADIEGVTSKA